MNIGDIACTNLAGWTANRIQATRQFDGALVVSQNALALDTISLALRDKARLILVTDATDEVTGFVSPTWLKTQLETYRGAHDLLEGLREMAADPTEILRNFHHEWLKLDRPTLHWCERGNHLTDENPCSAHKG